MSTSFTVSLIEAKSDVPLYLYNVSGGGRKVVTTAWQTLWTAPNTTSDSFAAFDLSLPSSTVIGLRLTCTFGSSFSGKTLEIQGLLNGTLVTSSPVTVTSTGPIVVQKFVQSSQRGSPVSYRGLFQWRLRDGSTTVATFGTQTSLELYTVVSPPAALWPSVGISVNLLRAYVAVWNSTVSSWALADFYRYVAQTIFGGPFKYDNQYGAPRYTGDLGGPYALDQYFRDLASTGAASITINCYDMAGIVQVVLSLFANYSQVRWNYMKPYGWINTTTLKGYTTVTCNNPFWGNSAYYPNSMAPVDYTSGQKQRSDFANHAYIVAPTFSGSACILDATSGPHVGNEDLNTYLQNSIDHVTNYYAAFPGRGPGTPTNISPSQTGVTSITNLAATATPTLPSAPAATVTLPVAVEATFSAAESAPSATTEGPSAGPVDRAIKRAKVANAGPARHSSIEPNTLKALLEVVSELDATFEAVDLGDNSSETRWRFGAASGGVEVTLVVVSSHDAALARMRETLGCVSAPLDVVFVQTVALGQYSLQGVGGRGYALFIRGNVFVKLVGLASSAELCTIATAVDHFLQAREGSPESIPGPRIAFPQAPSRQVGVGETFEMTVEVPDAGWMTACTNAAVVQLLEVDTVRATFKFYGTAEGTVDIRLVFAHQNTLRTTAVTVSVEVVAEEFENVESG